MIEAFAKRFNIDIVFIKFLLVGFLNTLVGYGFYAVFVYIGCSDITAPLFSTICSILFNYKTTGKLVFNNSSNRLIFRFCLVYLFTYVLTVLLLKAFAAVGFDNLYISGAIILLLMAFISFFLNKNFVFKTGR